MKLIFCCLLAVFSLKGYYAKEDAHCASKTAFQSSNCSPDTSGENAVDGNNDYEPKIELDLFGNVVKTESPGCASTATGDKNPWLIIDLGCTRAVKSVKIVNRKLNAARLNDFTVTVHATLPVPGNFKDPKIKSKLCAYQKLALPAGPTTLTCPPAMKGKYVMIRFRDPAKRSKADNHLHICDVDVE